VFLVERAPIEQMLLDERHVIERVHMQVLVIGENEDDVWPLAASSGVVMVELKAERVLVGSRARRRVRPTCGGTSQKHGSQEGVQEIHGCGCGAEV
jgi:hypothetical protein